MYYTANLAFLVSYEFFPAKCNSTSFKTNDRYYFEKYPGLGWMIRTCPQGSRYVSRLCGCQTLVEKETRGEDKK